jgi:hypothetical protein
MRLLLVTNFVILNVTEGGVRDLLYLPFNIGAKTVFTIGVLAGDVLDAAFPSRKAAHNLYARAQNCENGRAAQPNTTAANC